jgi:putative oxidoreductase
MHALVASYSRLTTLLEGTWYAIPLRLMVGYGFMEHGYAKLARGPESFVNILHAIGVPEPSLLGGLTILTELIGGFAVLIGAFIPLASIPMAAVLLQRAPTSGSRDMRPTFCIWQRSVPWCWEGRDHWQSIGS